MPTDLRAPRPARRRGLLIAGVAAACIAVVVVASGIAGRMRQTAEVKAWTRTESIPTVSLVSPTAGAGARTLTLPGTLQAFFNAPIYSRVPGYVHAWYVDIGARVKAGQALATIDTPELDQQIAQARADVATAQANRQLAATTAARWTRLLTQDAVSRQESDEKTGDLAAKTAQVAAAQANLSRLLALKGFSRIVAPFDGVVTARKTDIGALVNAGAAASPNSELFDVAKIDKLRLYVRVPQVNSGEIRPGVRVTLTVPEAPGRRFPAVLDTTANAISDNSGTLLTELLVANPGDVLKPGAYAEVSFEIPSSAGMGAGPHALLLPSSALLFRSQGLEAAVVDSSDHVRLRRLGTGRNLGQTMEITSGLQPDDRVIDNPPDAISEGQLVRVVAPPAGSGRAGQ
jgi:RND family efflux transporter MFP subunit